MKTAQDLRNLANEFNYKLLDDVKDGIKILIEECANEASQGKYVYIISCDNFYTYFDIKKYDKKTVMDEIKKQFSKLGFDFGYYFGNFTIRW